MLKTKVDLEDAEICVPYFKVGSDFLQVPLPQGEGIAQATESDEHEVS